MEQAKTKTATRTTLSKEKMLRRRAKTTPTAKNKISQNSIKRKKYHQDQLQQQQR